MYLIALQVDPYTAVLVDGQEFAVENDRIEIMVDPKTVTVDQILEKLK
jgi:predicted P-loop ATPase/GTPase